MAWRTLSLSFESTIKSNMPNKDLNELREKRKQMFAQMEQKLKEMHTKEDDSLFYIIPLRIVLSCR